MLPTVAILEVAQNADYQSATWQWNEVAGTPVNLTGATATLTIRARPDNTSLSLLSITDTTGITLGGVAGTISFVFTNAQTALLNRGEYFFTLRIASGGLAYAPLAGTVLVTGSTV